MLPDRGHKSLDGQDRERLDALASVDHILDGKLGKGGRQLIAEPKWLEKRAEVAKPDNSHHETTNERVPGTVPQAPNDLNANAILFYVLAQLRQ